MLPVGVKPEPYVLSLAGRIDALHAPELDAELAALFETGEREIVVDLSQVSYLSSSGLRTLLLAHRRQQSLNGRLVLIHVPPKVMRVLSLAGFDRILTIRVDPPTLNAAPSSVS